MSLISSHGSLFKMAYNWNSVVDMFNFNKRSTLAHERCLNDLVV